MGVSYAAKVYTQDKLFIAKLLFRWTGSVWQLLWLDLILYVVLYVGTAFLYRNVLFDYPQMRRQFEFIATWISELGTSVPVSFLLGFFVTSVLGRWWDMVMSMPWVMGFSFFLQSLIHPATKHHGDITRKIRITILRYLNTAWILLMGDISMHIKKRFSFEKKLAICAKAKEYKVAWKERLRLINNDNKVKKYFGCLITKEEIEAFDRAAKLSNDDDYSYTPEWWLPLVWASRLLRKTKEIGCISDDRHFTHLLTLIGDFRSSLGTMWVYSEFNIPLVYTQVATIAVYTFVFSTVLSTQLTDSELLKLSDKAENQTLTNALGFNPRYGALAYIPVIGILQLIFYLGWFKIGMCLMNPLGKDKEDLPLSDILNANLKASIKIAGAEESLLPTGLLEHGNPEEQVLEVLNTFDFGQVHAHDTFESPEETQAALLKLMKKRKSKKVKYLNETKNSKMFKDSGISLDMNSRERAQSTGSSSSKLSKLADKLLSSNASKNKQLKGSSNSSSCENLAKNDIKRASSSGTLPVNTSSKITEADNTSKFVAKATALPSPKQKPKTASNEGVALTIYKRRGSVDKKSKTDSV